MVERILISLSLASIVFGLHIRDVILSNTTDLPDGIGSVFAAVGALFLFSYAWRIARYEIYYFNRRTVPPILSATGVASVMAAIMSNIIPVPTETLSFWELYLVIGVFLNGGYIVYRLRNNLEVGNWGSLGGSLNSLNIVFGLYIIFSIVLRLV